MKQVYIASPLRGDYNTNIQNAVAYCRLASEAGVLPLAPHIIFSQWCNDTIPEQRDQGLKLRLSLLEKSDELWVMGKQISQGMQGEIAFAKEHCIPTFYVEKPLYPDTYPISIDAYDLLCAQDCVESADADFTGKLVVLCHDQLVQEYRSSSTGLIYDGMDKTVQAMNSIFVKTGEIGTVNILNTDFQKTVETDDWTKSVEPATVQSAGTYTAKYTNGIQTVSKSFEISKASPIVTISDVTSGEMGNRKATLTIEVAGDENGTIPGGTVKLIDCTSGSDVDIPGATAITMAEGRATFEWTGLANQEYTVKVIYSGDANYNGVTATEFKFDTTKQNQAALNIGSIGTKTYGDGTFTISSTGGNGGGAVTFESSDPTIVSIAGTTATIHKAGTVTITATKAANNTYNEVTASVSLTVGKKTLSVKADDKLNVVKGAAIPELTYTATGLVGSDTFTSPSISTTATDTSTVGEYDITISGGTLANADSYAVTYTNGKLTVVNATYTVTVTNGTGGGSYSEGQTVTITADSRGGYTFTGWSSSDGVTFASNTASTTTFTMPGKAVTVTANYSKNSSGDSGGSSSGGSSSGGSSTSTTITTPEKKPNQPVTAVAPVTATAGSNGAASASIPDKAVTDAIAKAQADAKAQGKPPMEFQWNWM